MDVGTIVVPDGKPAYEWVRGRALQKMSPSRRHAVLQRVLGQILSDWAGERGWVGTEWRFYVTPEGEPSRPLVPDVAYIAAETLGALPEDAREYPPVAPHIVIEILSPGDRAVDVDHKREVYASAGTALVLVVDPVQRTLDAFEQGSPARSFTESDRFRSNVFPDLTIDLAILFMALDKP